MTNLIRQRLPKRNEEETYPGASPTNLSHSLIIPQGWKIKERGFDFPIRGSHDLFLSTQSTWANEMWLLMDQVTSLWNKHPGLCASLSSPTKRESLVPFRTIIKMLHVIPMLDFLIMLDFVTSCLTHPQIISTFKFKTNFWAFLKEFQSIVVSSFRTPWNASNWILESVGKLPLEPWWCGISRRG